MIPRKKQTIFGGICTDASNLLNKLKIVVTQDFSSALDSSTTGCYQGRRELSSDYLLLAAFLVTCEHKVFLDGLQYGAHLMNELFKEDNQ